jgi:hypothetical protein
VCTINEPCTPIVKKTYKSKQNQISNQNVQIEMITKDKKSKTRTGETNPLTK